jgi:ubiquinone/menaquinone biosynthesis C-methylase UbiE
MTPANLPDALQSLDAMAAQRDLWKQRNRGYHAAIARIYKFYIPKGQRVLEIGCSTGDLLADLEPACGVGIDLSPKAVELAQAKYGHRPNLKFICADAHTFKLDGQFDYVVLSDTIGFLQDVQQCLEQLRQVMQPHSRLVLNSYSFVWEAPLRLAAALGFKQKQPLQNWLSNADVANLLNLADFELVQREGFLLLPKRIPLLSALCNGLLAKLPGLRALTLAQFAVARPRSSPPVDKAAGCSVSIIVPARNEAGNIEAAITRTPPFGAWQEFIFVEGHSKDNTWDEIQRVKAAYPDKRIKIMQQEGKGKKDAVYKGFAHATGDILMILDADLTMPPEDLPKFYRAIADNKGEFINGVRLVYPMEHEAMRLLNLFGNKFFSMAFSYLLNQPYKDTLCGTKVMWRTDWARIQAGQSYFGDFDPFGDFDMIFGAAKLQLKAAQIPIRYRARSYGETQISRFSHGWLLLRMTWIGFVKFKWRVR